MALLNEAPELPQAEALARLGVAAVFTPKDFSLTQSMAGIVRAIREANGLV